ncbi:GATA zinc finger domain-containing protein 14 [Planococcus citri]|uniref:GATA zinc finger domain-containing protein 14 n=1 Tax=Planococcus citri TaxID=170843 RepID=UPI0031F757FF
MNPFQKELSRPPIYNPEDYALSLKKWTSKPIVNTNEQNETPQPCSAEREMSLRQFSSISDLLNKLKTDLRLAYISFVQEFVADPIDGITLLLELLRTIQANDSNQHTKATSALHRRSLLDENSCLQCLRYSLRCPETTRRLAMAPTGLFSLTVCIMSSVSKSRIIALELLTKICCYSIAGHNAVSEAMSTMRLRFGEPVRFRFLVSMLNGAAADLLLSGLRFINTFLETSPKKQIHFYIQAELEQAGFSIKTLKDMMPSKNSENEAITEELNRWSRLYIDVEVLKNNHNNKCKEISALKEKISELEAQIRVLQSEKQSFLSENRFKERSSKLNISTSDSCSNSIEKSFTFKTHINYPKQGGENSTPAEDEGISSSDQDDSEENNLHHQNNLNTYVYGAQNNSPPMKYKYNCDTTSVDPTIDEVMKGFQNLINEVKNHHNNQENLKQKRSQVKNSSFESVSRAIIIQEESDIIPSKILPEPPKKSRSLHFLHDNIELNPFFEDESADNSRCSCSSQECCSSAASDHEYSKIDYSYENDTYLNKSCGSPQVNGRKNTKLNGLKRSETFHYLQNEGKRKTANVSNHRMNIPPKFENKKNINQKNNNYIIQNSNNFEKELKNKNLGVKQNTKVSRSVSTKPLMNQVKAPNSPSFPPSTKINPISYFLNKSNGFPTNVSDFTLKRHNNAGLYSGQNHVQNSSSNNYNNNQVTTITSSYPKRCAGSPKEINYNGYSGKIMDFPSGLY